MMRSPGVRPVIAAAAVLGGSMMYNATRRYSHGPTAALTDLLGKDLDAVKSPIVMQALGVQMMLFAGFTPSAKGWVRSARPPSSLAERVDAVAPSWKPRGRLDYSWPPPSVAAASKDGTLLRLFTAATAPPLAVPGAGATTASLSRALESLGLDVGSDLDAAARRALVEMLTWRLPHESEGVELSSDSEKLTLLVLSFDATPDCRSVHDCPRPGPSNQLLAATADAFVRRRATEHGQKVDVLAQWEVAAALKALGTDAAGLGRVSAVGTPGQYENTFQIFELMLAKMGRHACGGGRHAVVLAHPDHLRRSFRIGETVFARAAADGRCGTVTLVPAMQSYRLDWTSSGANSSHADESSHARLNLFKDISAHVHTAGEVQQVTWYDAAHGFFPDGEPQQWVHSREVWICYEFWARAKGVATGMIAP